jgi:hypothetical protein
MEIKRQEEALCEDDVVDELEKLSSNWKLYDRRVAKDRIKLLELNRTITK